MNTCKTALRILKSRKMYLVIYLGFIGIMMFAISWKITRKPCQIILHNLQWYRKPDR